MTETHSNRNGRSQRRAWWAICAWVALAALVGLLLYRPDPASMTWTGVLASGHCTLDPTQGVQPLSVSGSLRPARVWGIWVGVEANWMGFVDYSYRPPVVNVERKWVIDARAREQFAAICASMSIENGGELLDRGVRVEKWRVVLLGVCALALLMVLGVAARKAAAGWRQWRRWRIEQRELRRALCTKCAYDLSGLPPGRCPECGAATPST